MVIKTVVMLCIYFIPLVLINAGWVANAWQLFGLYMMAGLGMAGIGMGVMHDAIHGSYSKDRRVNKCLGYTMNLIGANANIWRIQHNVLHHTYTNIDALDDDINAPFFLRFSPHAPLNKLHRYQHLYVWVFYGLSTLSWITTKDFIRLRRYHKMGLVKGGKAFVHEAFKISMWKIVYFTFSLVIPLIMVPLSWWLVVLAFITMHFITGLLTSLVFQAAHVVPGVHYPLPSDEGNIDHNWYIHQLMTTNNFSPNNRIFSWLIGGLNYQIEHHLWPNISHVHYHKLSSIVAETAARYGIPYYVKKNFFSALIAHAKMLKQLGRQQPAMA